MSIGRSLGACIVVVGLWVMLCGVTAGWMKWKQEAELSPNLSVHIRLLMIYKVACVRSCYGWRSALAVRTHIHINSVYNIIRELPDMMCECVCVSESVAVSTLQQHAITLKW